MKMLNLGCGSRFSEDWVNIDFVSNSPHVMAHNLTLGIPFPDNTFDVVYHSHVLEHFSKEDGELFIKECYRVLKPTGILRVAVPDLENIAKSYLNAIEELDKNNSSLNHANHYWSLLELIDQMVRTKSGGEIGSYWQNEVIINESFVNERVGFEFLQHRKHWLAKQKSINVTSDDGKATIKSKIKLKIKKMLLGRVGLTENTYSKAMFRFGGEVHQWMYDRFSLHTMLESSGFSGIRVASAFESSIPLWEQYQFLDVEDKFVRKPDSLFMEAVK